MSPDCWIYWARPRDAQRWQRELFTDAELGRADAYRREVDRDRFTVGCALSRIGLGELLGLDPTEVPLLRDCADCGRPHGRPRLADDDAFVSVSHSGDHVVVAITRAAAVGIDVEEHDERSLTVADTVLTTTERARLAALSGRERVASFFRHWTGKEAALKAIGRGLSVPMASIELTGTEAVTAVGDDADLAAEMVRLRLVELAVDERHSAALAFDATALAEVDQSMGRLRLVHRDGGGLLRQR